MRLQHLERRTILTWLGAVLAAVPMLLFAYLGTFSRLMSDDYCIVANGKDLGAWETAVLYFNTWTGSYSRFIFCQSDGAA